MIEENRNRSAVSGISHSNEIGKRKALIIAVSDYDNLPRARQLPFCKNDGDLISNKLQELGYYIPKEWKLIGQHRGLEIKNAIIDFFRRNSEPQDTLLFYFSGHGIPDGFGGHFLSSPDIDPTLPEDNGFSFQELQNIMKRSVALKKISILDCCFSGSTEISMGSEEDGAAEQRGRMEKIFEGGQGVCILASSLGGQQSFKMKGEELSVFTRFLVDGLSGGSGKAVNQYGIITPSTLGDYVYNRMVNYDKARKQVPVTKTAMSGNILLAYLSEFDITQGAGSNIVKIKGGFYESETVDKIFKDTEHKSHLAMYLINYSGPKLEEGKNWNFDVKSLFIFNNSKWNIYWGKKLYWAIEGGFMGSAWKRFLSDDKGNIKGITHPVGIPVNAEFSISEEDLADIGKVIYAQYVDQPYKMTYDLLKIVDEETIIGKAYIGKFPKGREIGSFSMSRQYDLDFMGEDDFFMLFNSKRFNHEVKGEEVIGKWNVKIISDFIPPVYQRPLTIDLNKNDLKGGLIRAISERTEENETVNYLTEFDNQFRIITQNLAMGIMKSTKSYDDDTWSVVKSKVDRIMINSLIKPEVSEDAAEARASLQSKEVYQNLEMSSLVTDNMNHLSVNLFYVLQRVTN